MGPVQKPLPTETAFPFELVFRGTKMPQVELPDHWHDWWEIVYVYCGRGSFLIDHLLLEMRSGDLFIIPGNTVHRAMPNAEDPVTSTAVFFDLEILRNRTFGDTQSFTDVLEEQRKLKIYKYSLQHAVQSQVQGHLATMQHELYHQQFGFSQGIILELQMMFLQLCRSVFQGTKESNELKSLGPSWLQVVLTHIQNHLSEPITLNALAKIAQVSAPHLSRIFKQMTGLTVVDYILFKRITLAKEQLLHTNDKVHVIALNCGFESLPHFHRTFKKLIGMTPLAYRLTNTRAVDNSN